MKRVFLLFAAVLALMPAALRAQRLEAIGVGTSFNISQTRARESTIQVDKYLFRADDDGSRLDDTGNRYSVFARLKLGAGRVFVQPEVAYTSVLGNQSSITYFDNPLSPYPNNVYLYPRLRRVEVAGLAGVRVGRRQKTYLLAGPVLARYVAAERQGGATAIEALQASIYGSQLPTQVLGQLGIGWQLGRFDLNARYERSLTPYSREFRYQGQTYAYRQRSGQALFTAGFLLYDQHRPWRK
ncbi:hypothetical protein [Hymenobacter sediminicola]|uniref:Outer membrane beta-barrel protein n=1 Tax=Hymenobacter sediminicola TaxID=2761579 RepID=A0A7G7W5G0_9BACT|nr:hypothetical protein [Hymenobacter sediminicola]QNH61603.1 hypothetical protein H4317_15780 [Hymenobacter sediminicola]